MRQTSVHHREASSVALPSERSTAREWLAAGLKLTEAGRGPDADAAFEHAFALDPALRFVAEAMESQNLGDGAEALRSCDLALAVDPDNLDALKLKANLLLAFGRDTEAERIARRTTVLAPAFAQGWVAWGLALAELDRGEEALTALRRATDLAPDDLDVLMALTKVFSGQGAPQAAVDVFDRVLALAPDHAPALMELGHARKTLGDHAGAVAAYRACLALTPDSGEVWWSLANLKTMRFTTSDIDDMKRLLAREDAGDLARASVAFSLGKAAEDIGDHRAAFTYYAEGNARQRQRVRYDPVQTEAINDRIITTFDAAFFEARRGQGCDAPDPIFIVGLPRSGSTLIEQILASHSQVDGTSELPTIGRLAGQIGRFRSDGVVYPEASRDLEASDFLVLGRAYLDRSRGHRGDRPRFTDKMPNNFASVGLIHAILPDARIIDARRHPMDACFGGFKQLFARGQTFTYDLFELGEYYLQYDRMMRWWDEVLPGRVLRVDYEDVVLDQEAQTRRILDHCGLPWEPACLDFHLTKRAVNTASSEQVRQPLYRSGMGAWRHHREQLADLEAQLRPVIAALPDRIREAAGCPSGEGPDGQAVDGVTDVP